MWVRSGHIFLNLSSAKMVADHGDSIVLVYGADDEGNEQKAMHTNPDIVAAIRAALHRATDSDKPNFDISDEETEELKAEIAHRHYSNVDANAGRVDIDALRDQIAPHMNQNSNMEWPFQIDDNDDFADWTQKQYSDLQKAAGITIHAEPATFTIEVSGSESMSPVSMGEQKMSDIQKLNRLLEFVRGVAYDGPEIQDGTRARNLLESIGEW